MNKKEAQKLVGKLQKSRKDLNMHLPQVLGSAKKLSAYVAPEDISEPVFTGSLQRDEYTIEKYFLKGESDYIIPYLLFVPDQPGHIALIYLHPSGKGAEAAPGGEIEWFVKNGYTVLAPDLIGTGEMGPGDFSRKNYFLHAPVEGLSYQIWNSFLLINKTIAGIRAGDVVRLARLLKSNPDVQNVCAVAVKESAPVLFACGCI